MSSKRKEKKKRAPKINRTISEPSIFCRSPQSDSETEATDEQTTSHQPGPFLTPACNGPPCDASPCYFHANPLLPVRRVPSPSTLAIDQLATELTKQTETDPTKGFYQLLLGYAEIKGGILLMNDMGKHFLDATAKAREKLLQQTAAERLTRLKLTAGVENEIEKIEKFKTETGIPEKHAKSEDQDL